ncbi:hypothetical protein WDU94_001471 [Cyamophila willieti]
MKLALFTCLGLVFISLNLCLAAETSETRSSTPRRVRNPQVIIRAVNTGKSISTSSSVSSSSKNSSSTAGQVSQASTVYPNPLYTSRTASPASQANGTTSQQSSGKSTRNSPKPPFQARLATANVYAGLYGVFNFTGIMCFELYEVFNF